MFVGIDLGTTHSLVAVWQDGCARLVPNALGKVLTPSVVSVDSDGRLLVGEPARERLQSHPHLSCSVFKRDMGTARVFRLGEHLMRAEELSALVLRSTNPRRRRWRTGYIGMRGDSWFSTWAAAHSMCRCSNCLRA